MSNISAPQDGIPASWDRRKIKFHLSGFFGGGTPSKDNEAFWTDGDIPWVSPKDMKRRFIDSAEDQITEDAVRNSATNIVPLGSVLMVVRSGILKHSLPVAINTVPVALNQDMKAFQFQHSLLGEFFAYWIEGQQSQKLLEWSQIGATVDNININTMLDARIATPDLATQRQIADFLDRETARIDLLIEKKQRLLALLGEKFRALRHTAIARGAPEEHQAVSGPNQWFDRVPKSWTVKPLRHVVLFQRGHDLPADARTEGKYPIYSSGGISGTHSMCSSKAPGIVTGRYGTIGKFHFVEEDYWALNTSLYSRTIYEHPKYVFYLLEDLAHIFILNSAKSAVPGVDRNDIHSELVPVAPRAEQIAIAEHLDALKIDLGIIEVKTNASITRLREYRSALITAAVTGQLDVTAHARAGTTDRQLDRLEEMDA
ncbi:MAG: restriction endonuclease subunit S [Gemmobacter sp.]|nr:restriction endonuclease subunit S [Gemmobacter sp.]